MSRRLAILCALVAFPVPATAVTFFDGVFADGDWTLGTATTVNGGTASGFQVVSGGNPGEYREIDLSVSSGGAGSAVFAYSLKLTALHDPSVQGEILSIDYSEDGQLFLATQGASASRGGPALSQAGTLYHYVSSLNITNPSGWSSQSLTGLTSNDFRELGTSNRPDFSPTGSQITFGFVRANSTPDLIGYITESGIDNWSLELIVVPEPASLPLVLLGLLGMRLGRRVTRSAV